MRSKGKQMSCYHGSTLHHAVHAAIFFLVHWWMLHASPRVPTKLRVLSSLITAVSALYHILMGVLCEAPEELAAQFDELWDERSFFIFWGEHAGGERRGLARI